MRLLVDTHAFLWFILADPRLSATALGLIFTILPIKVDHAAVLTTLPLHHRDPFDRLLIAQTMVEAMRIVSIDSVLDAYPVTRLW